MLRSPTTENTADVHHLSNSRSGQSRTHNPITASPAPAIVDERSTSSGLGNLFNPGGWLHETYPTHFPTITGPDSALGVMSDKEHPSVIHGPYAGRSWGRNREVDDVVDWPVVLAFIQLFHEKL